MKFSAIYVLAALALAFPGTAPKRPGSKELPTKQPNLKNQNDSYDRLDRSLPEMTRQNARSPSKPTNRPGLIRQEGNINPSDIPSTTEEENPGLSAEEAADAADAGAGADHEEENPGLSAEEAADAADAGAGADEED